MFCLLNGDLYCLLCVAKCVFLKCGLDIWQQASVQQCAKCSGGVYCKASSCQHPVRCHVLGSRYGVYCKATSCKQPLHCKMLRCRYGGYCKAMQCKQPLHCGFATLRPWCVCVCLCVCCKVIVCTLPLHCQTWSCHMISFSCMQRHAVS